MVFDRSSRFVVLLGVVFTPVVLASVAWGETARERRHREIHQRLAETADLEFPYFAPSVHIRYRHPEGSGPVVAYYNEIEVKQTVKHTYFCVVGFDVGYLGIQDHASGPLAIFSVWDRGGGKDDPNAVEAASQTRVLFTHQNATSSRFGGEGSGAKTMMPLAWEVGHVYRFLVLLTPQQQGTLYTAWIAERGKRWQKIASYRTVMTRDRLQGFYSFVEDYARTGVTGQSVRHAVYPEQAVLASAGSWRRVTDYRGTIADDVIRNGHSGVQGNAPFSKSGAGTIEFQKMPDRFKREVESRTIKIEDVPFSLDGAGLPD